MNQQEEHEMGVIIGVMVGYALGSRAGAGSWSEIEEAWQTIAASEEVRDLVAGALAMGKDLLSNRAELIVSVLGLGEERDRLRQAA
jgi:hypothetical protein